MLNLVVDGVTRKQTLQRYHTRSYSCYVCSSREQTEYKISVALRADS